MVSTVTNRNPAGQRQNVLCEGHQSWGSSGSARIVLRLTQKGALAGVEFWF
jgi:hypothetical protein